MKYIKLFTNRYSLALLGIALLALLCIMATSKWTLAVVAVKAIGFGLAFLYCKLFNKWDREGKVDVINELFNDNDEEVEL